MVYAHNHGSGDALARARVLAEGYPHAAAPLESLHPVILAPTARRGDAQGALS